MLVLYHPTDPDTVSLPTRSSVQPFAADYYMFTSYIMPEAQLSVSDSAVDGYYSVSFRVHTQLITKFKSLFISLLFAMENNYLEN